jgi:hypothetical protein
MMDRRLKTCRTCGKLFLEPRTLNKHKILHDEDKAQLAGHVRIYLGKLGPSADT